MSYSSLHGERISAHEDWRFGVTFAEKYEGWDRYRVGRWSTTERTHPVNIVIFVLIFTALLAAPFAVIWIYKRKCKLTSLTITESQVIGSYSLFLSQKRLEVPVEDIKDLMVKRGFMGKMLCGNTLEMRTAFHGVVKFPFVQNADEIVNAARERMRNPKK